MTQSLPESLHAFARGNAAPSSGDTVIIAVSGGQDSCALLHAFVQHPPVPGLCLVAAHLHHGIRGPEADDDASFIRELCQQLGVACEIGHADVPLLARDRRNGIEEAGRFARREFLNDVADRRSAQWIATGHTADDQAETILMHILRGCGADGLSGIAPVSGRWVRPILGVRRQQTAAYCGAVGLQFRTDPGNHSLEFRRNRVRLEILPIAVDHLNPRSVEAICRMAGIVSDEAAAVQAAADALLVEAGTVSPDAVAVPTAIVRDTHVAIARRLLRTMIARIRGSMADVSAASVERVLNAVGLDEASRSWTLPGNDVRISLCMGQLSVARAGGSGTPRTILATPLLPGENWLRDLGCTIRLTCESADGTMREPGSLGIRQADLRGRLCVRSRAAGDRIRPRGLGGTKKLQDLFVDRKVPLALRDRVPVVVDDAGPLWVPGHAVDERIGKADDNECVIVLRIAERSDVEML